MVYCAAAFLGVEELADFSINRIGLAAHDALIAMGFFEEFFFGFFQGHVEILGDAGCIAVMHFDDRVRAAIAWAFQAIIFWCFGHWRFAFFELSSGGLL